VCSGVPSISAVPDSWIVSNGIDWMNCLVSRMCSIALRESYDSYFQFLRESRTDLIFIESASPSWEHDAGVIRCHM
jgi:hypothetical protein